MLKLGDIGDCNPIEYGGGYIVAASDDDRPTLEYYHGLESTHPNAWDVDLDDREQTDAIKVTLYRVDLASNADEFRSDLSWVKWSDVARTCDWASQDGDPWVNSKLPQVRAWIASDVASHYGWHELDSYPLELTLTELIERWKDL